MKNNKTDINWKKPWIPLSEEESKGVGIELKKEISEKHQLYGVNIRAIAKRIDCDDVLFEIENGAFAVVHLTYAQYPEPDPQWPYTIKYNNVDDLIKNCLVPNNEEFEK